MSTTCSFTARPLKPQHRPQTQQPALPRSTASLLSDNDTFKADTFKTDTFKTDTFKTDTFKTDTFKTDIQQYQHHQTTTAPSMKPHLHRAHALMAVWLLAALAGTGTAHSWPEQTMRLAPNGTMIGKLGYDRGHIVRGSGPQEDWLIPPNGQPKVIQPDHKIVRPGQRMLTSSSYSPQFPMLQVAPGDFVAIQYAENGHVTSADKVNPLKPINRGTIYLYGTTENDLSDTNLVDIHLKWTADGKGGNGKGRLLATRNFDDGQCHEAPPASGDTEKILTYRSKFISKADLLLCQSDLQIPTSIPVGQTLTVIWVWDWPDMDVQGVAVPPASYQTNRSDSNQPYVTLPQLYTGVVDYKVVDPCDPSLGAVKGPTCGDRKGKAVVKFANQQAATTRGIRAQMLNPFLVEVPQAGFSVSAATANPTDIPMNALIGLKPTQFPLPSSILQQQDQFHDRPTATPATPTTAPSRIVTTTTSISSSPASASKPDKGSKMGVVTVTVTVPKSVATVTVTREGSGSGNSSGTTATASGSSSPPAPTVTRLLPRGARAERFRGGGRYRHQ